MSACCVFGCKNRHSSSGKLKFYRIPSGYRPFQANRRRLWLQAIQQVNGSAEELKGNVRVCGAHFISGEASMDHDNPDFVPSVFTCSQQSAKKKAKWIYGRRKRRRRKANLKEEEQASPSKADSPADNQSSVLMEETETPSSPAVPNDEETSTKEGLKTKTLTSQTTPSPNKASPLFEVRASIPALGRMSLTVRLKPLFTSEGMFQCELCNKSFTDMSQLVKHKHEEEATPVLCQLCGKLFTSEDDLTEHQRAHELAFPCNMCDRSFTTSHNLKRHKLLHVKDGRKCRKCGVLFCRLHNHVLFVPQTAESLLESAEPDPSPDLDAQRSETHVQAVEPAPTEMPLQTVEPAPPGSSNPKPLPKIHNALPPTSHIKIMKEIPIPVRRKHPPARLHTSFVPTYARDVYPSQQPELPPSLKIFSPQYLTSAFLDVRRNYEYILSKPKKVVIMKDIVKEEPCEVPLITPEEQCVVEQCVVEPVKRERIAYDLEIIL